jgi:mono/diheme cytochrome c family protein
MRRAAFVRLLFASVAAFAIAGCGTGGYSTEGSRTNGKEYFTQACKSCHTLADASPGGGNIGPNLDDAFAQARTDGLGQETFAQVVHNQIKFPIEEPSSGKPGMPGIDTTLPECSDVSGDAFCVDDQDEAADDIASYVAAVAGTGAPPPGPPAGGGETDGKSIFASAGCANCHRLADAGSTGTVGPDLDQAKPSKALAVDRVTNGKGAMPSFRDSLNEKQIQAVAEYVSSAAGK